MNLFLNEYLSVLKLEKNLSDNTVSSYKNDINSFFNYLEEKKISDPSGIKYSHIVGYFKLLNDLGLASSSAARYYSSLKGFFSYLFLNKYITENPMEKISSPKLAKNLPPVLSVNEIESILSKPRTDSKLGLRDKSLLEMLYACGTRVSELINIKLSDLFFNEEVIRVFCKGYK
jgi:integrase/recombinase XerD